MPTDNFVNMLRLRFRPLKIFISTIAILLISFNQAIAQDTGNTKVDSLLDLIANETQDSVLYRYYSEVSKEMVRSDRSAAVPYLKQKYFYAKELGDNTKMASSSQQLGTNYLYLGYSDSAKVHIEEAIDKYADLDSLMELSMNLNNLALIYQRSNEYERAIQTYQEVLIYSDSLKDYVGEMYAFVNLMSVYMDLDDYDRALQYAIQFDDVINKSPKDDPQVQQEINNTSPIIYLNKGLCYVQLDSLESASLAYERAMASLDSLDDSFVKNYWSGYINNGKGELEMKLYENSSDPDEKTSLLYGAYILFDIGFKAFDQISEERGLAVAHNNKGRVLSLLNNSGQAERELKRALSIAEDIEFREQIRDSYKYLADNASNQGKYREANEYLRAWVDIRDSIRNDERTKIIQGYEVRFETAQKEKEISELALENELSEQRRQNQLFIFLVSVLLLLGTAMYLFNKYRLNQQKALTAFERKVNLAMSRFVPMAFINAIGREKITEVELGDQIEKVVTVVFTDIRKFTTISEGMSPSENFQFVKDYAERMGPIIERNGGFISQYLGDGIMAIFQNSPTDALLACLEMQEDIAAFNAEREDKNRPIIKVGMGMHTGPLIMGIIGDETRRDATLISDTVNTASRIENTTKEVNADILLSQDSFNGLDDSKKFKIEEVGVVNIKGKNLPIQIFKCVA